MRNTRSGGFWLRQVWNTIAKFHMFERGDHVLIGVSGGPDSVALLHMLHEKAEEYGITLYVVHVHHMLRSEADEEAAYVERLAERYGIAFRLYQVNVAVYATEHGMSLEQAGHEVRFQCFRDAKKHWGIHKLALGHHKNDRAESVLLHILQGSGLDGITAMPPVDIWDREDASWLVRPFSYVGKQEIVQYCTEHQLQYFIDATNLEPDYLRNQIRLSLLPQLQQYNPQVVDALVRMQDSCSADLTYLDQQVQLLWESHGERTELGVRFAADLFRTQHIALQRRLLRWMYQLQTGCMRNLSFLQVEQMREVALRTEGTQRVSLTGDVLFMRQYDTLCMMKKQDYIAQTATVTQDEFVWNITEQPVVQIWNGCFSVQFDSMKAISDNTACAVVFADADQISVLQIRNRRPGDLITLPGKQGHKTVKKLLIDKKVPQQEREQIPLVFSHDEIVWIPGCFMADCIKITEKTKRICKLCFSPSFSKGFFEKCEEERKRIN